ncbi:MAG: tetratricopeptide repeat protein [Clostridium sp.]
MKKGVVTGWMTAVMILTICLTGCGEPKAAKEARLQGIAQMEEEQYSEAIASFDTALQEAGGVVNKFELDILKYRGEAEYRLKDYAAAEHTYGILLEVDGEQPEYRYYKAAAGAAAGHVDAAVIDYDKAVDLSKNMKRNVTGEGIALSAIGTAYANQKDYDKAIEYFDRGIALGDETTVQRSTYNKGAVYEQKGDFAKALEIFTAYSSTYGSTPELEREITFLKSR